MPWVGTLQVVSCLPANGKANDVFFCNVVGVGRKIYLPLDHPWAYVRGEHRPAGSWCAEQGVLKGPGVDIGVDRSDVQSDGRLSWLSVPGGKAPFPEIPVVKPVRGEAVVKLAFKQPGGKLTFAAGKVGDMTCPAYGGDAMDKQYVVPSFYYDAPSSSGDCGGPVLSAHGIVGIHSGACDAEARNLFVPLTSAPIAVSQGLVTSQMSPVWAKLPAVRARHHGKKSTSGYLRLTDAPAPPAATVRFESTPSARSRRPSLTSVRSEGSVSSRRSSSKLRAASKPAAAPQPARKARSEALVSVDASPSDYLGSGSRMSPANGIVKGYVDMITNPWSGPPRRLPDTCISPTGVFKLNANRTYTVATGTTASAGPNLAFGCMTRLSNWVANSSTVTNRPLEALSIQPASAVTVATATFDQPYHYQPGCIMRPLQWGANGNPTTAGGANLYAFVDGVSPTTSDVWGDDYGADASTMASWVSAYRVLAMAMRFRIIGMAPGVFIAPGKLYVAQVRNEQADIPITEQDYVVLERMGRASHVSVEAVRQAGSKTFYITPDSANKFDMTSNFLPAPGTLQGKYSVSASAQLGNRVFPNANDLYLGGAGLNQFQTGAGNGLGVEVAICPYNTGQSVGSGTDSANADSTSILVAAVFGAADGLTFEVDYVMCGEYIADKTAPPGLEMCVQTPDHLALDAIFAAAAAITELKPVLFQAAGDVTQTVQNFGPGVPASAQSEARRSQAVMRTRGTPRPGSLIRKARPEGFWDSLTGAFGAGLSSLGRDLSEDNADVRGQRTHARR
jgi:hypothetical protein